MDGLGQASDFQQKDSALSLDEGCYPEIITPPLWEVPCILKDHQGAGLLKCSGAWDGRG